METLPNELLLDIFIYLDRKKIREVSIISKKYYIFIERWRELLLELDTKRLKKSLSKIILDYMLQNKSSRIDKIALGKMIAYDKIEYDLIKKCHNALIYHSQIECTSFKDYYILHDSIYLYTNMTNSDSHTFISRNIKPNGYNFMKPPHGVLALRASIETLIQICLKFNIKQNKKIYNVLILLNSIREAYQDACAKYLKIYTGPPRIGSFMALVAYGAQDQMLTAMTSPYQHLA